ncbi:MAG: response regulator [Armatimonadota bacterium]
MDQLHVLVVDDDPDVLLLFQAVGRRLGHKVSSAVSAEDALRILGSENPPDVVLVDLDLRGSSGEDICKATVHRLGASVRVFLMTADPLIPCESGADYVQAVLTKPFDVEGVFKLVSSKR